MEVVVFSHEDDVGGAEQEQHGGEIDPARGGGVGQEQDGGGADGQLQQGVERRHLHVADVQFVGHQLVGVLAVRLAEVLVEHDAVADGQHRVHSVDGEQHDPAEVAGPQNQGAQREQQYERYRDGADIAREAARLRAEVEEAEYQRGDCGDDEQTLVDEPSPETVDADERQQHGEGISAGDAVDAVHEVERVDYAHEENQRERDVPPGEAAGKEAELQEHQGHGGELSHQPHGVGERAHVVGELHHGEHQQAEQEPGVCEAAEKKRQQSGERKDNTAAAYGGAGVGTAAVGPVDYAEAAGDLKIKQLREKQGCKGDQVWQKKIHRINLN